MSVVVPVFRDAGLVETCVRALAQQTYPEHRYEIIVVDNGDNGDLAARLAGYRVTVTSVAAPSQSAALNGGVAQARGTVLAFTDADCVPRSDWIERGVAALRCHPGSGQVGGAIEFVFRDPLRQNAVELYDSMVFLQQACLVRDAHFAATANMFTWRTVFDAMGGFDTALYSGNDADYGRRVFAAGYAQMYAADARVYHPARGTWLALYRKIARTVGGEFTVQRRTGNRAYRAARDTIADVVGPLRVLLLVWGDRRFTGWRQRLQFIAATFFARSVRLWERTRLLFGARPRRSTR